MKTTAKDFEIFKNSFLTWQFRLSLGGWRILFNHTKLEDMFADITIHYCKRTAVVQFTTEYDDADKDSYDPWDHGMHECLHLLLADLDHHAHQRCASYDELLKSEEEIVVRLQNLFRERRDASVRKEGEG